MILYYYDVKQTIYSKYTVFNSVYDCFVNRVPKEFKNIKKAQD